MEELTKTLMESGLSKTETDTYIAIISNGPISAGNVAKLTHNYRANTYQTIERLKSKGYISEIHGKKSKLYEALSPNHILKEFKQKTESLEKVIPLLDRMRSTTITTTSMRIITGIHGWKYLLDEFIDIGKERVVYGIPRGVKILEDFFKDYHKKRAKKKIKLRHLFNYDAKDRIKITNKLPFTKSRYLPKELNQPVSTSICGSIVALTVYDKKTIYTIVIDNKTIANAYREYFEFLWVKSDSLVSLN